MIVNGKDVYGIIYKITNTVTNQSYIGQTKNRKGFVGRYYSKGNTLSERVYNYYDYMDKSGNFKNNYLFNSIKKHGFENFYVNKVFDVAFSKEELDIKEKLWIKLLGTYKKENGYNLSMGGCIGSFNDETLKRMSEAHKGSNNHFYGKHHTDEAKKIMSEKKKGLY